MGRHACLDYLVLMRLCAQRLTFLVLWQLGLCNHMDYIRQAPFHGISQARTMD